jgi:L-iditol 2-dehydrogenase
MNALILEAPQRLSLKKVDIPMLSEGEVLLQVKAATTCGTDLKAFRRGHPQIPMPGVFGHEYSGVVVSTGENCKFKSGDALMGVHSAPCGNCFWCQRNQENLCESIMATKVLGAYAEYLVIPKRIVEKNVFLKPQTLSFEVASLLEPYACVAQGIRELLPNLTNLEMSNVLVIGPGAIGLLFVAALKTLGVNNVVLAGRNQSRLEVGAKFGAKTQRVGDVSIPDNRGFDAVIECTGQVEVWEQSIDYVRKGGALMLFGGPAGGTRVSFDTHRLHYDQITVLSPFHFGTEAVRTARDWMLSGQVDLSLLLSGERCLEEGEAIFRDLEAGLGIKYVVKP